VRSLFRVGVPLVLLPFLAIGCRKSAENPNTTAATQPESDLKSFPVRGKVVSVDTAKGSIVLDHEAIPGFMDAMTMPYALKDKNLATELHPGDRITATLLVRKTADGWEDAKLDKIVVIAQGKPDYKPAVQYHVPEAGDAVPDFKLTNQSGHAIHLGQFKGKAVLITFIYTRCPMPDFCPKMNHNFAEVDKALAADPATYSRTHLLSISFDPKNDTPSVLKDYAQAYAGVDAKFTHWEFAVPPAKELDPLTQWFDVGISPAEDGTITHSLSTVLIDKDGHVAAFYPSNDWTPTEVVQKMKSVA
jgi:protein SCO1/2